MVHTSHDFVSLDINREERKGKEKEKRDKIKRRGERERTKNRHFLAGKHNGGDFPASLCGGEGDERWSAERRKQEGNNEEEDGERDGGGGGEEAVGTTTAAIGEVRGVAGIFERQRVHLGSLPVRMVGEGCVVQRLRVAQRNPKRLDVSDSISIPFFSTFDFSVFFFCKREEQCV